MSSSDAHSIARGELISPPLPEMSESCIRDRNAQCLPGFCKDKRPSGSVEQMVRALLMCAVSALAFLLPSTAFADVDSTSVVEQALGPEDVLILVNQDSPVSRAVCQLYRFYYPAIRDKQVLMLSGLNDSAALTAGPSDEIISREDFETLIAQPLRDYLIVSGQVDSVYCLITTAGMPYRIEDSNPSLDKVVCPPGESGCGYGSNANTLVANRSSVNAATVEADLSLLFQIDPDFASSSKLPINNRLINPYQAYASPIKAWAEVRNILARRETLRWTWLWKLSKGPLMEGIFDLGYVAASRIMSPADIYLVARLDGPRHQGESPLAAVKAMLGRSMAVSNPQSPLFVGYNPLNSAVVIDDSADAPPDVFSYSELLNYPPIAGGTYFDELNYEDFPTPPSAEEAVSGFNQGNHYDLTWFWLTNSYPFSGTMLSAASNVGMHSRVYWDDTTTVMSQSQIDASHGLVGLMTYGRNAGDGRPYDYLLTSGPNGGSLFNCVPGAVFTSLESFNGVTMFIDAQPRLQGLVAEFIEMGGSAAIGHAFEPERLALIHGDYLMRNLLRDDNSDGICDLSLVEACYSGLPFLGWGEFVLGDPLMRYRLGPGGYATPVSHDPEIVMAVSRMTHGTEDFDLPLFLQGQCTGASECRGAGATQIVVTFSEPVDAGGQDIECGTHVIVSNAACTNPIVGSGTHEITISLDPLAAQCACLDFVGLTAVDDGAPYLNPEPICWTNLSGDVTQSHTVNILDYSGVKATLFQAVTSSNYLSDVDLTASINILDLSAIKYRLGSVASCP